MKVCVRRGVLMTSIVVWLLAIGCGGMAVDLGEDASARPSLEGTWTATLSSDAFLSSPKALRLVLDAGGHGTLLVGEEPLPPPTDPTAGHPPEAEADAAVASGLLIHLYEGVEYSLEKVSVRGSELHFEVDAVAAFEPTCRIQTPLLTDTGYHCLENSGGGVHGTGDNRYCYVQNDDASEGPKVDCLILFLCGLDLIYGCACAESGCSASKRNPIVARFDLALDVSGNSLTGKHRFGPSSFLDGSNPNQQDPVSFVREAS